MAEIAGWISLDRRIMNHHLWRMEPFTKGQAWVDLLLMANHTGGTFFVRGIPVNVKRGQVAKSELTLAERWMWSRDKVRRYLSYLKSAQMILIEQDNKTTTISICNYDKYQNAFQLTNTTNNTADDTPDNTANKTANNTPNDTADDTQTIRTNNINKSKRGKNETTKRDFKPGVTLTEYYRNEGIEGIPTEWREFCIGRGWTSQQIESTGEAFWLYWTSDDCKAPKKRNWNQTWQQWCIRQRFPNSISAGGRGISNDEKLAQSAQRIDTLTDFLVDKR